MAMNITELHAENFEQEVVNADRPVCIDFWAPWCGPCRMLSPVIEELAAEEPAIKFCKVNVDDEPGLAAQFGVSSIPTLIFSKKRRADRTDGGLPAQGRAAGADRRDQGLKLYKNTPGHCGRGVFFFILFIRFSPGRAVPRTGAGYRCRGSNPPGRDTSAATHAR